jgi:flagellar assembly protein FliH
MSIAHLLQDFGPKTETTSTLTMTDVMLEEQKLASYEAGYQAGWDDSADSNRDAGTQISADFSQNIRDLSMTYHEAYGALMADIKPLVLQIVNSVLPEIGKETLGPRVLELIEAEISDAQQSAVLLFASPQDCAVLQPVVTQFDGAVEVALQPDDTLAAGQVHLRLGLGNEHEINTQALIDGIRTAVWDHFQTDETIGKETA